MAIPWQDHLIPDDSRDLSDYVPDPALITPVTNWMKPLGPSIWMISSTTTTTTSATIDTATTDDAACASMIPTNLEDSSKTADSEWSAGEPLSSSSSSSSSCRRPTIVVGLQGAGGAWIWNPQHTVWTKALDREIQARCGAIRHLVLPNQHYYHSKHFAIWSRANPQAKIHVPPDFDCPDDDNITVDFVLTEDPKRDYVLDIDQVVFRGSHTVEVVFFHRPSETVLFCDLLHPTTLSTTICQVPDATYTIQAWSLVSKVWGALQSSKNNGNETDKNNQMTNNNDEDTMMDGSSKSQSLQQQQQQYGAYCHTPPSWQWSYWWNGQEDLARNSVDIILQKWKPRQLVMALTTTVVSEYAMEQLEHAFAWVPPRADDDNEEERKLKNPPPFDKSLLGNFQRGTFST